MDIKVNRRAIRDLLREPGVRNDLERRARAIAAAAGSGMETDSAQGKVRARATVWTGNNDARRAEATDRALTRAIDAGRS